MEKKIIRIDVGEELHFNAESNCDNHTNINELIALLNNLKKFGATHIDWRAETYDGCSEEVYMQPFFEREETDEEFSIREFEAEKELKSRKKTQEMNDFAKYLELKKKFENK